MDNDLIPPDSTAEGEPTGTTALTGTTAPAPATATPAPPTSTGQGGRAALIGAFVALALVVTFSLGIGVGRLALTPSVLDGQPDPASAPAPSPPTEFGLIKEAWDTIHQQYVAKDELNDQQLIYGAIEGLTQAVGDTGHTDFMTPAERAERNDALSGSYVGIGVRIDETDLGMPRIVSVFKGSPAEAAGLGPDDLIVAVDGRKTVDHPIDEIAGWVRGEAGTSVVLTVRDGPDGVERTVSIIRADVPIEPVMWTMVPGTKTALIRLEQFSSGATDEMVKALQAAKDAGADRLVLDLRGNPGGYVNEAVGIASQFLASGLVYIERNASDERTEHPVTPGGIATDLPLVVVVDGDTASSSEIVSGALQDAGRAKVVGETTFGTGTVLGEFALSDGSALRIGTVEWLTPTGRRIWHEGIAPDVPVTLPDGVVPLTPDDVRAMTPADVTAIKDAQLAKALEVVAAEPPAGG
jgi:carboxyl-terminal processing protease